LVFIYHTDATATFMQHNMVAKLKQGSILIPASSGVNWHNAAPPMARVEKMH